MPKKDERKALREEMKQHRLDYYAVPGDIFWDDDLTATEQRLLVFVAYLDQGPRGCYASNTYLAAFANCHESTIKVALKKFVDRGFLFEVPWDGIERRLYVTDQYRPMLKGEHPKGGRTKIVRGVDDNVPRGGRKSSSNMDESSEGIYISESLAHKCAETEPPSPAEVEWALDRIRAKKVHIGNPESTAARALIRDEVMRLRAEREAHGPS